jgi:hypothetical protein
MNGTTLSGALPTLLVLAGVLFGLTTVGIGVVARRKSDSQHKLHQYVLLGGIFNFLSCLSMSAILLVDASDLHSRLFLLPIMLFSGIIWGGIGALSVFQSVRFHRRWKKQINRLGDSEVKDRQHV